MLSATVPYATATWVTSFFLIYSETAILCALFSHSYHSLCFVMKNRPFKECIIISDASFLSVLFVCQSLRILGPDPLCSHFDCFWEKYTKCNIMFWGMYTSSNLTVIIVGIYLQKFTMHWLNVDDDWAAGAMIFSAQLSCVMIMNVVLPVGRRKRELNMTMNQWEVLPKPLLLMKLLNNLFTCIVTCKLLWGKKLFACKY